jgi:glucose-1-phosphate thymidylyltransferase
VVDRPREPASTLALAGVAAFTPAIFAAARAIAPSWRGRLELADAVTRLVGDGATVGAHVTDGWWACGGRPEALLEANRVVLDELVTSLEDVDLSEARVRGRVSIHPSARISSSVVRGPAIIGAGAQVYDARIGPYTSIGRDACVDGAEVEDSIVLPGALIQHLALRLEGSVIGTEAKIFRDFALPNAIRVWVGDGVEVSLV